MRVAIDCRKAGDYGIGTYIRGLLRGLSELPGDESYLLLAPRRLHTLFPTDGRFESMDVDVPAYSIRELFVVGRAAERRADLLHLPHYVMPQTRLPVVTTIHDLIHLHRSFLNPVAPIYARWMLGRAVHRSKRILTVSQATADEIAARWPDAAERIRVTPNGVDASSFGPQTTDSAILSSRGLEPQRYLLCVGNDKPHKNLDRLVEAFSRVHEDHRSIGLVIAGCEGARFAPHDGISFAGWVSDIELRALYANALAVTQPSLDEGFGLPVLEAMASGVPVAASNIAAVREVAGECVIQFDGRSIDSMVNAIREMVMNELLRGSLITCGRDRALSFTWKKCAEMTLESYRQTLSR